MATKISDVTPTPVTGSDIVPVGVGSGKTTRQMSAIATWILAQGVISQGEAYTTNNFTSYYDTTGNVITDSGYNASSFDPAGAAATAALGAVENAINSGTTTKAPSEDAVYQALLNKLDATTTVERISTLGYTLVAADANKLKEMNFASAANVTVPASTLTVGRWIYISWYGTGQPTIVGSGMTIRHTGNSKIGAQYGIVSLLPISATECYLIDGYTAGDTLVSEGALINSATSKTTPVDADQLGLMDSTAANILKKLSWANLKATMKTYTDTLYPSGSGTSSGINTGDQTLNGLLPSQTGNNGKVLQTDGSNATWQTSGSSGTVSSGSQYQIGYYATASTTISGSSGINTDVNNALILTPTAATTGSPNLFKITAPLDVTLTAATEASDILIDGSANSRQFTSGSAITVLRQVVITPRTYRGTAATTATDAATFAISGPPVSGTNMTLTRTHSIWIQSGESRFDGNIAMRAGTTVSVGPRDNFAMAFRTNDVTRLTISNLGAATFANSNVTTSTFVTFTQNTGTSGAVDGLLWTAGAHTNQTAAEKTDINWNLGRTVQFTGSTGFATQRAFRIQAPTYGFVSATGTLTDAATLAISGAPTAGTNAVITNPWALLIEAGNAKYFGKSVYDATITAGGTTGNQTINKPAGTVNIAATGTTVTVTNSLCTTSSIILYSIRTNDTTALVKNIVPGAGSFVITMNAAVTAETSIGFLVTN